MIKHPDPGCSCDECDCECSDTHCPVHVRVTRDRLQKLEAVAEAARRVITNRGASVLTALRETIAALDGTSELRIPHVGEGHCSLNCTNVGNLFQLPNGALVCGECRDKYRQTRTQLAKALDGGK